MGGRVTTVLYRAHLVDGRTMRVRVDALPTAVYVEGDRYPADVDVREAVAAHGRSRGWTVASVTPPRT